jgi:hypothetical protein
VVNIACVGVLAAHQQTGRILKASFATMQPNLLWTQADFFSLVLHRCHKTAHASVDALVSLMVSWARTCLMETVF